MRCSAPISANLSTCAGTLRRVLHCLCPGPWFGTLTRGTRLYTTTGNGIRSHVYRAFLNSSGWDSGAYSIAGSRPSLFRTFYTVSSFRASLVSLL